MSRILASSRSLLRSSLTLFFFNALRKPLAIIIYLSARSPIDIRYGLRRLIITQTFSIADILLADITDIADIMGILLTPTSSSS
jgi:hypothetical protein